MEDAFDNITDMSGEVPLALLKAPVVTRKRIAMRAWRAADRQLAAIEKQMERSSAETEDGEPEISDKNMRSLSVVAKTLKELAILDQALSERVAKVAYTKPDGTHEAGDENFPETLDDLRARLAQRLEALRQEREDDLSH